MLVPLRRLQASGWRELRTRYTFRRGASCLHSSDNVLPHRSSGRSGSCPRILRFFPKPAVCYSHKLHTSVPHLSGDQALSELSVGSRAFDDPSKEVAVDLFKAYARRGPDGEPVLQIEDLKALLRAVGEDPSSEKLEHMVQVADRDKNGVIDLEEFLIACDRFLSREIGREELEKQFVMLDSDRDGYVTVKDLRGLLTTAGTKISEEEAEEIVRMADQNDDGQIDLREFIDLITSGMRSWKLRSGFRVIFVSGGPGSGKGTVCGRLAKEAHCYHVSSGDLLRDEVKKGSSLGLELQETMSRGELVKGAVVMALLKKFMSEHPGRYVLLDGFPRSKENVAEFEATCGRAEMVIVFDCPEEEMIRRIVERGKTSGRLDDTEETAQRRLQTYYEQSKPALEHFASIGVPIYTVSALGSEDEVFERLMRDTPLGSMVDIN